jgi:hypothetical protein
MVWAGLVALGVAVVSMTMFGARLTRRRRAAAPPEDEFMPSADPDDPWSAYKPRPFAEVERRRPRIWPALVGVFGIVLVAGGVVGARQSAQLDTLDAAPTAHPAMVTVTPQVTPTPLPASPTPAPQVIETPKSAPAAAAQPTAKPVTAKPSGDGPKITGSAMCSGGTLQVSVQMNGTKLTWFGLYVDGKVVKGGPMSGSSFSTTYSKAVAHGDHDVEATAQDAAGHNNRRAFPPVHCA